MDLEHESALRIYSYMGPMTDIRAAEELCKTGLLRQHGDEPPPHSYHP